MSVTPAVQLSPRRAWSAVTALAVAVFAVTTTEMMPIGVLSQISNDLGVSDGTAGLTVTMYGVVAGLSAPLMTTWTRRVDRRVLVLTILGVFVLGNAATALVTNYALLLAIRFAIGLWHGLMWAIIASIAVRVVPPASAARATATVLSGISLALVLGVPAGSVMGSWLGWQWAFAALAAGTALTWVAVWALVPALPSLNTGQGERVAVFPLLRSRGGVTTVLIVTALVVIGNYAANTYIVPFLTDHRVVPTSGVGVYLLVFGVAGVIGNVLAGVALRRAPSLRAVLVTCLVVLTAALALLPFAPTSFGLATVSMAVWGLSYFALPAILQTVVFAVAPDARETATSLYVMVFNLAIAAGAFLGGLAINTAGPASPVFLGALFCGAAVCVAIKIGPSVKSDGAAI